MKSRMVISLFILLVLQAYLSITSSEVAVRADSVNARCLGRLLMTSVVASCVTAFGYCGLRSSRRGKKVSCHERHSIANNSASVSQ